MANGQFIIPESFRASAPAPAPEPSYEAQQAAAFSARLEARQYTPETHHAPYKFIKEIEDRLDSYRYTAIELEEAKRPWLKSMKSLIIAPKPLLPEFIDKESKIGGRLFQKAQAGHTLLFWSEGHEWFFGWSDGRDVSVVDSAVHYQVSHVGDRIIKSYGGHTVPLTNGEESHFINAVQAYEAAVRRELYPFDDEIAELMAEGDSEDLTELSYLDDLAVRDPINEDAKKDDSRLAA